MTANPDEFPQDPAEQLDQLQADDTLVDRGVDDALDEGFSPPERWSPAEKYGNTPAEERAGETLDQRLEQEEPDVGADLFDDAEQLDDGEVGRARAGRLVDPDEGIGQDYEAELVGSDVGVDGAGASAEEAAVHIVDEYDEEG
jgi:uncharacterized protein DUF5709